MASTLKSGDKVEWQTPQGKTRGTVRKKLDSPMDIKGHHVAASKETRSCWWSATAAASQRPTGRRA